MVNVRTNRLIEHLNVGMPYPTGIEASDADLLERYIASRDSASFAAIVQRHGPMVWGVCRRMLTEPQDTEDAFQATFLVLVRKAVSIVPRQMLGNWLHGVARQTSLKARSLAARRRSRERQVTDMPETEKANTENWRDLPAVIDEELARLPKRFRAVLIMCDLEGKTRKEAARQLGVPSGSVAGWLSRARAMLAKRLTRRGVVMSGGSLTAALVQLERSAKLPAAMVSNTIEAASRYAAGALAADAIRAPVALLTDGVLHSMLLTKLKATMAFVVAAGIFCTGITGLAIQATGQEPGSKAKPVAEPRVEKPKGEPADSASDIRQLKKEVDSLRTELDAIKKQLASASKIVPPVAAPVLAAPVVEGEDPKFVVRIYPIGAFMKDGQDESSLVRVITNTVRPQSWSTVGGAGTVEFFVSGKSLVVNQIEEIHLQIEKLLAELLKVKETQDTAKMIKK